jgi:hypothetical protein
VVRPLVIHEFGKFLAREIVAEAAKFNSLALCTLPEFASLQATEITAQTTVAIPCPACTAVKPAWAVIRLLHFDIPSLIPFIFFSNLITAGLVRVISISS